MEQAIVAILVGAWDQLMELWPYLTFGIVLAAAFEAFLPQENLRRWATRSGLLPVLGATAAGVGTPL